MRSVRPRGFTLISTIIYLSLLGVILLAVSHVFSGSFKTISNVRQWRESTHGIDSAIEQLREDVWAAEQAVVMSPGHMVIRLSDTDGDVVVWRLQLPIEKKDEPQPRPEDGHYVRVLLHEGEVKHERHYPMSVTPLRFASDEAGLVTVHLTTFEEAGDEPAKPKNVIHLPNLRRAVEGGR